MEIPKKRECREYTGMRAPDDCFIRDSEQSDLGNQVTETVLHWASLHACLQKIPLLLVLTLGSVLLNSGGPLVVVQHVIKDQERSLFPH